MRVAGHDAVVEDTYRRGIASRGIALVVSGVVLLTCVGVGAAYLMLRPWSNSLLIGSVSGLQASYIAGMIALVALTAFVFSISARRWWLLVAIPVGLGATIAFLLAMLLLPLTETKVTPLLIDGCSSGYIAVEASNGAGFVAVRDGLHVVSVHHYRVDDFAQPFSDGEYVAEVMGGQIDVTYEGWPGFSLPTLASSPCR